MRALFFDLDGTLVDSEHLHWEAWRRILANFQIPLPWPYYRDEAIGRTDGEILSRIAEREPSRLLHADKAEILVQKKGLFGELVRIKSPVSQETICLLRSLSDFPIALVTSSSRFEALALLEGAGITERFTTIVCLDDVQHPKPSPEPYLLAMERLNVRSGIAFEDSLAGQTSAASAGLKVVAVPRQADLPHLVESAIFASQFPETIPNPLPLIASLTIGT
jgi:HAD superfamily hydrolase (TIGR01509 family)